MAKNRRRCFLDIGIDGRETGRVVLELFDDFAPKTTENFLQLCTGQAGVGKKGVPLHYKGSTFHRIIKDFMIQGGDFTDGNGTGGESIYGSMFHDEAFIAKHDQPFLLSMANKGPDTNGSQFFITTRPTPHLNGKHVVFGRVVSGTEVVSELEHLKVDGKSRPIADVVILNCGELVRKRAAREEDSDDEKDRKKRKRRDSSSEEEGGKENGNEEIQVSTVKPEDLPPEPANQHSYLMRRSRTPEDRKKDKGRDRSRRDRSRDRSRSRDRRDRRGRDDRHRNRSRSPWRDSRDRRDNRRDSGRKDRNERVEKATGVKTKGRGTMRFNRDRDTTPPHWARETSRLKTLDDLHTERERLGGGDVVVRRMRGTHADANEDVAPVEKEKEVKAEEASPRELPSDHSDAEGVDLGHSDEESDDDEAKDQARALEAIQQREQEEKERKAKEEEEEAKKKVEVQKERSRSRSKSPQKKRSPSSSRSRSRSASRGRRSRSRTPPRRRSRSRDRRRTPERRSGAGRDQHRSSSEKRRSRSRDRRSPDSRRRDSRRSRSREERRRHSRSHSRDARRRRSRSSS